MSRTITIRKDHQDPWKRATIFVPDVGGNSNRRQPEPSCLNPHAFDNPAKQNSGEFRSGVLVYLSTVRNKTTAKCVFWVSFLFFPSLSSFFPSVAPVHLLFYQ